MTRRSRVLVTGGGGYVGSKLVPKLLDAGFEVNVLDLFIYGDDALDSVRDNTGVHLFKGDIRDATIVRSSLNGCDAVIHLACISNDPSFELNPDLGRSINYDAFRPLVWAAKDMGISRFIYASSSSVYGLKSEPDVSEEMSLEPLTDYSKYKAMCEDILLEEREPGFHVLILRPATVCGYAPRLRLDLTVNILTNHAINNGVIRVFGGSQLRPNIHIDDITDLYIQCLTEPAGRIDGKIYNAGFENYSVMEIAETIQHSISEKVAVRVEPTDDLRSYHISSALIRKELGFVPKYTIPDAVASLTQAFANGSVRDPMTASRYYNIKTMQGIRLR